MSPRRSLGRTFTRLLAAWLLLAGLPAGAQTLWVILGSDTSDPILGRGAVRDLEQMESLWREAGQASGLRVRSVKMSGENFRLSFWRTALGALLPGANDTILVYWSGPAEPGADGLPRLVFPDGRLDLSTISRQIRGKGARLSLLFAESPQVPGARQTLGSPAGQARNEGWRALLRQARGHLIAAAASPDQEAQAFAEGGAFTVLWAETLRRAVSLNPTPGWADLARQLQEAVAAATLDQQNPVIRWVP